MDSSSIFNIKRNNKEDIVESICIDDMSVLFGFTLFETFLVNGAGGVFLLEKHIERLINSMDTFRFDLKEREEELKLIVLEYIKANNIRNTILRINATYGNKGKGINPSIFITNRDYSDKNSTSDEGYKISLSHYKRNENSLIVNHKTANYMENYFLGQKAVAEGFHDVLFLNTKNEISETSKSNIFFIKDKTVQTPSVECGILPGITRAWAIQTLMAMGFNCVEGKFQKEDLLQADEVFLTNSVMGIVHVSSINNISIKNGLIGSITLKLKSLYQKSLP